MPDFLFTEFSSQNINANTSLVQTSGRAAKGIAPGSYVADALATSALLSAHPRFVAQSANGRIFRALPSGTAALAVELGGAAGDGSANDQPAIQAAISYAEAIGARSVEFTAATYRLHCPVRTSDPDNEHAYDGRPLVISRPLVLRSVRHGGSRLEFRHVDGAPRTANFQLVPPAAGAQPKVWRGGGIFLKCPAAEPANYADRPALTLEDITLDGGIARSQLFDWPARPSDGDGWDISDKGIWVEPDRFSGDINLVRSKIVGFRGELVFQAGLGNGELRIRDCVLGQTNGNLFQSCGTNLDIDGLYGFAAFQAFEGWSGRQGRMVGTLFEDCIKTGGIAGGRLAWSGPRNTPARFEDGIAPWFEIDAEFRDCGTVLFGSWVRGRVRLTDCTLTLDGSQNYGEGLSDVDLEVISHADRRGNFPAVVLLGSSTPGKQTLSEVRLRLDCQRTAAARVAGLAHQQPVDYRGSMGPNVVVEQSSGEAGRGSGPSGNALTAITDHYPCFRRNSWRRINYDWSAINQDIAANPQIVPRGDLMSVYAPTAGTWPITLPTTGIQHGHELTIRNLASAGTYVAIAANGAGAKLPAQRTIAPDQQIALRFDREVSLWRELAEPPPAG